MSSINDMAAIVLTDEQASIIATTTGEIAVRDSNGNLLGHISAGISAEEQQIIEQSKRRLASDQRRHSTKEVLDHLRSLEPK